MASLIALMGSGVLFLGGSVLLALAVLIRAISPRRRGSTLATAVATVAVAAIAFSATPLPLWLYGAWASAVAFWLAAPSFRSSARKVRIVAEGAALALIVSAIGWELPFELRPSIPMTGLPRLYVIGDSITAGIGREAGQTWPSLLRQQHGIDVVDLSYAGVGAEGELRHIRNVPLSTGLVLIEIGGNDVLAHVPPRQFGAQLDALVRHVSGTQRQLVMLELPLFPFDNAYGIEQRSVAQRNGVILIPRRYFAHVLSSPGATVDGIHLSVSGQHETAAMIWDLIGVPLSHK
jgi:lysophospholipase L1-like esterase